MNFYMHRLLHLSLLPTATACLAACGLNAVVPVTTLPKHIDQDRAILVYGIAMEGPWEWPSFPLGLDRYDLEKRDTSGSCWRRDKTEGSIPAAPGTQQYLAFDVPAGWYAYSPFNAAGLSGPSQAFQAAPGTVVYVGKFSNRGGKISYRAEDDRLVTLDRDLQTALPALERAFPGITPRLSLASAKVVEAPHAFLCAP